MKRPSVSYPFIQKTPFGSVKIYKNLEGGRTRFVVSWVTEEGRQRKAYKEEDGAHQRAREILDDLQRGFSLRTHITSYKAVRISEYEKMLAEHGSTLEEAVRFFINHRQAANKRKVSASLAVREYLEAFEDKESRNYQTARHILSSFAEGRDKPLDEIKVKELDEYLKQVSQNGRTRNNHLGYLKTLFRWAQKWHGYIPQGTLEIEKIPKYPEEHSKVELFTPEEICTLLDHADDTLRPYLALGAFAGVRCAEIGRLTWDKIDLEQKIITLERDITKTKRRRLAICTDAFVEWIKNVPREPGAPVLPLTESEFQKARTKLCQRTGIKWKDNGLRKSYISYRMAQPDWDAHKVAKQCGNSPGVVERDYKGLVMPPEAERWFSVMPSLV